MRKRFHIQLKCDIGDITLRKNFGDRVQIHLGRSAFLFRNGIRRIYGETVFSVLFNHIETFVRLF